MMKIKFNIRYLTAFITILLAEVLIAIYVHDQFFRPYLGDALVIVLIYCFARIFAPPYRWLPLGVFLLAAAVETAQLFNFVNLLGLQNNRVLSVALGSTFDSVDLLCYAVGAALVYLWQHRR